MSNKIIKIGKHTLEMKEYETDASERSQYGLNVYFSKHVSCGLWEDLMPNGTIREKAYRDVDNLWKDFICGDKEVLIKQFLSKLYDETGLNFHLANQFTLPKSLYNRLSRVGMPFNNEAIRLIIYANNK